MVPGSKALTSSAIVFWGVGMTAVVASLMVGHWVPLPHPQIGTQFPSPHGTPDADQARGLTAYHFLYSECPCSQRVFDHVMNRNAMDGVNERIVLIGDPNQQALDVSGRGFDVECLSPQEVKKKYGVESAPLLIVTNSMNAIVYSGGYTARKQGLHIEDVAIIEAAAASEAHEQFPLYGCAVSKRLKEIVDPIGLKAAE